MNSSKEIDLSNLFLKHIEVSALDGSYYEMNNSVSDELIKINRPF
jgi:hypothetical protein